MIADEPLWGVRRIVGAVRLWAWLLARDCAVPFGVMIRYHRRPHAQYRSQCVRLWGGGLEEGG
jgi:hypothetical protein